MWLLLHTKLHDVLRALVQFLRCPRCSQVAEEATETLLKQGFQLEKAVAAQSQELQGMLEELRKYRQLQAEHKLLQANVETIRAAVAQVAHRRRASA